MIRRLAVLLLVTSPASAAAFSVTDTDIDALSRVTWAEARGEPEAGVAAVVAVVLNRVENGGGGILQVLTARGQFEPVMRAGGWQQLPRPPEAFAGFVRGIVAARQGDASGGATHFQNPTIVARREAAGTVSAGLTGFGGMPVTATIGRHTFYRADQTLVAARGEGLPIKPARPRPVSVIQEVETGIEGVEEGSQRVDTREQVP